MSGQNAAAAREDNHGTCIEYEKIRLNSALHGCWVAGERIHLRPREFKLLRLFMNNPGKILSYEDIYDGLWEDWVDESSNLNRQQMVYTYVSTLRKKLGDDDLFIAIKGKGYVLGSYGGKDDIFEFGDIKINTALRTLSRNGNKFPCSPQEANFLRYILKRPGELIKNDDAIAAIWGSRSAAPEYASGILADHISKVRKIMGRAAIQRFYGQGFVFTPPDAETTSEQSQ